MNYRTDYEPMKNGRSYLARIVGIIFCGNQPCRYSKVIQNKYRVGSECILAFEFLDENLNITETRPLRFLKGMRYSAHSLSRLSRICNAVDPSIRKVEIKDGVEIVVDFDVTKLLYSLVSIHVRESKHPCRKGSFMIDRVKMPTQMDHALYREAPITTPYVYDVETSSLLQGDIKDIPESLLNQLHMDVELK